MLSKQFFVFTSRNITVKCTGNAGCGFFFCRNWNAQMTDLNVLSCRCTACVTRSIFKCTSSCRLVHSVTCRKLHCQRAVVNQELIPNWMMWNVFFCNPYALLILINALDSSDVSYAVPEVWNVWYMWEITPAFTTRLVLWHRKDPREFCRTLMHCLCDTVSPGAVPLPSVRRLQREGGASLLGFQQKWRDAQKYSAPVFRISSVFGWTKDF